MKNTKCVRKPKIFKVDRFEMTACDGFITAWYYCRQHFHTQDLTVKEAIQFHEWLGKAISYIQQKEPK